MDNVESKSITIVNWRLQPGGGIETRIRDCLKYLGQEFWFSLYSLRPIKDNYSFFARYCTSIHWGHSNNLLLYFRFLLYAINHRHHIFHIYNAGPIILLLLKIACPRKIIYHISGTIYWKDHHHLKRLLLKFIWYISLSDKILLLSNSNYSKKKFLEQISAKYEITVLYNGIDTSRFKARREKKENRFRVVYVGRLVRGKNLFLWIDIAKKLIEYYPHTEFKIAGEGPLGKELEEYVKTQALDTLVRFEGYIEDIENFYHNSDLMLFLSEYESFGNVAVESVLSGTPVIVSDIPSMKEIFANYPQFLVSLDNSISNTIIDKIKNLKDLRRLTLKMRQEFIKKYDINYHISKIREFYLVTDK